MAETNGVLHISQELSEAILDTLTPSLTTEGLLPSIHALLDTAATLGMYRREHKREMQVYLHAVLSHYIDREGDFGRLTRK